MPNKTLDHQSAAMKLCFDSTEGGLSGRVYSQRLAQPMAFRHASALLLQLDALMDEQRFPMAYQRIRTFTREKPEYPQGGAPEDAMSAQAVAQAKGERATALLRVITRQNATWQGDVDFLDGAGPIAFSSDLEFLKLLEARVPAL